MNIKEALNKIYEQLDEGRREAFKFNVAPDGGLKQILNVTAFGIQQEMINLNPEDVVFKRQYAILQTQMGLLTTLLEFLEEKQKASTDEQLDEEDEGHDLEV